ncbi:hypothetical protein V1478_008466 [Vespula squamosa]|uniref:Uncharacterized protein n=1 Tax=Vespula squamosa TaxID=30214 RepID=A0ABD2ATL0_VESSQ
MIMFGRFKMVVYCPKGIRVRIARWRYSMSSTKRIQMEKIILSEKGSTTKMAPGKRFARDTVVPTYLVPKVEISYEISIGLKRKRTFSLAYVDWWCATGNEKRSPYGCTPTVHLASLIMDIRKAGTEISDLVRGLIPNMKILKLRKRFLIRIELFRSNHSDDFSLNHLLYVTTSKSGIILRDVWKRMKKNPFPANSKRGRIEEKDTRRFDAPSVVAAIRSSRLPSIERADERETADSSTRDEGECQEELKSLRKSFKNTFQGIRSGCGSSGGNGGGGGGILTARRFNGGVGCRGEAENLACRLGGYFTRAGAKNVHFKGERITTSASHFPLGRWEEDREKDTEEYKDEESRARSFHGIRGGFLRFVEESTTARSRTTKGGDCGVAMVVTRAPPPRAPLAGSSLETRESVRNYDQRCGRFSDERRQQFNATHTANTNNNRC